MKSHIEYLCESQKNHLKRIEALEDAAATNAADRHSETTEIEPNVSGSVVIRELDENDDPTGNSTEIVLTPSDDSCNGTQLGTDGKHYSEDYGYRIARDWASLVSIINSGGDALVCSQLTATGDQVLQGSGAMRFVLAGSIDTAGHNIDLSCAIENPRNKQIFFNYTVNEDYPNRWNGTGTNLTGDFGGDNLRDPRWWGLTVTPTRGTGSEAVADQNNDAIAAASMSSRNKNTTGAQITVLLPAGCIQIKRTVRLDSLKCILKGQGANATQLWAQSTEYSFDTSHYILTSDYPTTGLTPSEDDGSTPMVEIGVEYQADPADTSDEGFNGGVESLGIIGQTAQTGRRISGLMWESGIQEHTVIHNISVQSFGGYGIGGPRYDHNVHNPVDGSNNYNPQGNVPQVNAVRMSKLSIFSGLRTDSIPMTVFGLNFSVDTATIRHGNNDPQVINTGPCIITGATNSGTWRNIHIENTVEKNGTGIGIQCPAEGVFPSGGLSQSRMHFESISYKPTFTEGSSNFGYGLSLEHAKGHWSCNNITTAISYTGSYGGYSWNARAIRELPTSKESTGYHSNTGSSTNVASYQKQVTATVPQVISSDPALLYP